MKGTLPVSTALARRALIGVAALLLTCLAWQPSAAAPPPDAPPAGPASSSGSPASSSSPGLAERLESGVTGPKVARHLRALQDIADAEGGNRGYARPGFTRSAAYVSGQLTDAGYKVTRQSVPYTDFDVRKEDLSVQAGGGNRKVRALMTRFTPSTAKEGIDARAVSLPEGRTGCQVSDYDGVPVKGAVVVLARNACGFGHQQKTAAEAGAVAVLLSYPTPSPRNIYRLIGMPASDFVLPMASVSQEDGERLAREAAHGDARVHLTLRARDIERTTVNLIAETRGGDPDDVVLMGGHLDSVPESPGINDNGSTAATVLQTALELAPHQGAVRNKVRFMWWGAEELVNIGSSYYVDRLSEPERQRIAAVINGELLAPSNHARFVWDPGSGGGHALAGLFTGYFDRHQLPYDIQDPSAIGSDHLAFEAVGIPTGGIDGGNLGVKTPEQQARYGGHSGQMFDPCYHQTCDRLDRIDRRVLGQNAPALAWVVGHLATDDSAVRSVRQPSGRR